MGSRISNMPVERKITLALLLVAFISLVGAGIYTYFSIFSTVERLLGQKLDHVARTATMLISWEDHKKLEEIFQENPQQAAESPEFNRLQATLRQIKKQNGLREDIYTVIAPDWAEGNMIFMAMSNEKPYVGNALPANKNVLRALETGEPQFSGIYKDHEGEWVSAFAPIKDNEGKSIGVFEVDFKADGDVWDAKLALIKSIGVPGVLATLFAFFFGTFVGRGMTIPLKLLAEGAKAVASGDLTTVVEKRTGDEFGLLTDTFNAMVADLLKSKQQLQDYAKNLELKVEERTKNLFEAKKEIETLLNNLGQGFMVIDQAGKIRPGSTKAASVFFGLDPSNRSIGEVLRLDTEAQNSVLEWLDVCFANNVDFASVAALGPSTFEKNPDRFIELSYRPIFDDHKNLDKIICIAEDKTKEKKLERKAIEEQEFAGFVTSIVKDREGFMDFVGGTRERLNALISSLREMQDYRQFNIDQLFRHFHTIKGESASYHILQMKEKSHAIEDFLSNIGGTLNKGTFEANRRAVLSDSLLMKENFENFLSSHKDIIGDEIESNKRIRQVDDSRLHEIGRELKSAIGSKSPVYVNFVESLLLEEAVAPLHKYAKMVESLARQMGKAAKLTIQSDGIKLPLADYLPLFGSCVHLLRNSIDHGLETPEERDHLGKPIEAQISLRVNGVSKNGETYLRIRLQDDGRGIDPELVGRKAIEKGLKSEAEIAAMSKQELMNLVFMPGFSTKDQVTEISGRGAGLDAVKYEATRLGGTAWLESEMGKGTTFIIEVPVRDLEIRDAA